MNSTEIINTPAQEIRTGAVLFADVRGFAQLMVQNKPEEAVKRIDRFIEDTVAIVRAQGGLVHQYVAGSLVAWWPASALTKAGAEAIEAAARIAARDDLNVSVGIALGEVALVTIAISGGRSTLLGPAYERAKTALNAIPAGGVAVDLVTYQNLPSALQNRFTLGETCARLQ